MRRPLRLSRKVYRSCLLAALSAALICIGIFAGFAYNQVCLENARNLREEAAYIAQAVELSGVAYLEKLSPEDGSRVTWIAADGQVLHLVPNLLILSSNAPDQRAELLIGLALQRGLQVNAIDGLHHIPARSGSQQQG